ncbi:MAG: hypothetical protein M9921_08230 [Fimbriimonadaceae bacterium]|nr:hypothetical protein [Fimbriimonadaceae bacterium]
MPPRGAVASVAAASPAPRAAVAAAGTVPLWELQRSLMGLGDTLSVNLGKVLKPSTAFGATVHRMLRAALLDADVYREAAANASRTTEAAAVAAASLACVACGTSFLAILSSLNLMFLLTLLAVQAIFFVAFVVGAALLAPYVVGKKQDALALGRSLAYAQSVGVLGIVPVVGPFFTLWRLVTMTVAIKDGAGVPGGKAALLMVVGIVCGIVAVRLLAPIVLGTAGGWGGLVL